MPPCVHWGARVAALTGVAGALLAPGLSAAAGNLGAGEGALGALSAIGEVVLHNLMHNDGIGRRCQRSRR